MGFTIAVAGKGGTGKTTLSALVVRYLKGKGEGPILAVDADPNANLGEVLGLDVRETVGRICDEMLEGAKIPPGMPKDTFMEYRIQETLIESSGYDLLVMGRPEGPGCYCYANTLVRKYIDMLSGNYGYLVMDNEAGMEHLSRRTTRDVDILILVSDPTLRGIRTARKISDLANELKLGIGRRGLVINRVVGDLQVVLGREAEELGLELLGVVPEDRLICEYELGGKSLIDLPEGSRAVEAVRGMMERIGLA